MDDLEFQNITLDAHGPVALLTLNRPAALNALNTETLREIAEACEAVADDPEILALILTGSEKAFAAGADIKELAAMDSVYTGRELSLGGQEAMQSLSQLPIPSVACIQGYALGGGLELALCCDIRVAAPTARLGMPEADLGLLPGFGGTQRLPRIVGLGRALDLLLTGRQLKADEALQWGLVTHVSESPLELARELAEKMAARGPVAMSLIKEAVRRGLDIDFQAGLEIEADLFGMAATTDDFREGAAAFLDKRQPRFEGK